MDRIGQDQHADLAAELGQRVGQGIAVLSTLTEASARLAAEEMRRRARREEQQHTDEARRDREAQKLGGESDKLAQYAARQRAEHDQRVVGQVADPDWLARADLLDLATVWRTARAREHEAPEYAQAAERVEDRLREMYPRPMDLYDEAVRAGVPRADAMRTAAQEMARTPVMRAHGGGRAGALHAGDEVIGDAAFAAAVTDEQIRLATGVDPSDYAEQLNRLGAGGAAAAQALRETLAAQAGQELADGRTDAAAPDNPATAVNEHTTGLVDNKVATGDGERYSAAAGTRNAAQLAGEWYPEGLNHPGALPPHVAGKRPATTTSTQSQTRAAGRTR
ncbi:hypothetical protein [Micromonospora sp. NPDC049662]|uniref:hypothetical protein n=1 Tax=Micromonospora sp. NPDC049662 TaxID=3155397 RepID=UPI00341CB90C